MKIIKIANIYLIGHELGQTPGDSEGEGGLACYIVHGVAESDTT